MTSESATAAERVILAFQERYWRDEAEGAIGTLASYLEIYPAHQELIASEYMTLRSGASTANGSDAEGLDRIGPYLLEGEIGRGGQGLVYRAKDERLGRTVALKVLTGLGPGAEKQIARFKREAEVAARLEHPGICGVHDAGVENGVPYIAMRFVEGETLQQRISRTRQESMTTAEEESFLDLSESAASGDEPLEDRSTDSITTSVMPRSQIDAILQVFEKAARALHAAHEAGVVHRDVKPGNIMITEQGEPVLLDFGLAQDDSHDSHSLTMTGDLFGTPAYMSPEQIAGQRIHLDARSDVYSLAVTLYESLTLRRPWEAATREALYQAIMTKEAPDPRRLNKAISKDLKVVLDCALEKDRDRRYVSAEAFADDLAAVREGLPVAASPIGPIGRAWRWSKRRPMRAALLLVLAIGIPLITGLSGFIAANLDEIEAQKQAAIDEEVELLLEEGFFAFSAQRNEEGIEKFEAVLVIRPSSTEAVAGLVLTHRALRRRKEALEIIERWRDSIDEPELLLRLEAQVLRESGRAAEAEDVLRTAPEPLGPLAWFFEGLLEYEANREGNMMLRPSPEARERSRRAALSFKRAVESSPRARRSFHLMLVSSAGQARDTDMVLAAADALEVLWPDSPPTWFNSGRARGDLDREGSIRAFRRNLELEPRNLEVAARLVLALQAHGELEDAATLLEETRARALEDDEVSEWLGLACSSMGDLEGAAEEYRRSLLKNTNNLMAVINLSGVLMRMGKLEKAAKLMAIAAETWPDLVILTSNYAELLRAQGKLDEALAQIERSIELDPTSPSGHRHLAHILLDQGKETEALVALQRSLDCDPEDPKSFALAGPIFARLGETERAIAALQTARRLDPREIESRNNLAAILWKQDRFDESLELLEECADLAPKQVEVRANLLANYAQLERFDDARRVFRDLIALDPENGHAWASIGQVYLKNGEIAKAREAMEKSVALAPEQATFHLNLARFHAFHGSPEERLAAEQEALRLDPESIDFRMSLSESLANLERSEEAEIHLREVLRRAPRLAAAHRSLGVLLTNTSRPEEAAEHFQVAVDLEPEDRLNHINVTVALAKIDDREDLIRAHRRSLEAFPEDIPFRVQYVLLLYRGGDFQGIVDQLEADFARGLENPDLRVYLGLAYGLLDRSRDNEEQVRRAYELLKADASSAYRLRIDQVRQILRIAVTSYTNDLLLQDRFDQAREHIEVCLADHPEVPGLEAQIAVIDELLLLDPAARQEKLVTIEHGLTSALAGGGNLEAACRRFESIIRRDPDDVLAHNDLAWHLVNPDGDPALHDPARALPHARRAVELTERKNPSYLDTLAVTLAALGEFADAVAVQEEVLRLMGGQDAGNYKLADAQALLVKYRAALAEKKAGR